MRVEVFLKNGCKLTLDNVYDIVEHSKMITFAYDRQTDSGDFTTCDTSDCTFDTDQIDMAKILVPTTIVNPVKC